MQAVVVQVLMVVVQAEQVVQAVVEQVGMVELVQQVVMELQTQVLVAGVDQVTLQQMVD
jgi:hypothetical protein